MAGSLILLRHGKTALNGDGADDKIRGHKDVPLDATGKKQAAQLADASKAFNLDCLHSSDLSRALDTAKAIADANNLDIEQSDAYRPWHLGDFQGESSKEVSPELRAYVKDKPDQAVPGGESFNSFKNRFIPAFEKLLGEAKTGKNVGLVTHYRNAKMAQAYLDGGPDGDLDLDTFLADDLRPAEALKVTPSGDGWKAAKVVGGSDVRKRRVTTRKDMPASADSSTPGMPANVPLGPTLNSSHVDRPLKNISTAYVRPKKKRKVKAKKDAPVQLVKSDAMRQIIYGVALEPHTVDSQGDAVRPEEIERAAHGYLMKAVRGLNAVHRIQHGAAGFSKERPAIVPVESYIAPADFQFEAGGDVVRKGSWVLAAKVNDPALWNDILAGKFTGWSVGGSGLRTPIAAAPVLKDDDGDAMLDRFMALAKAMPAPVIHAHVHMEKDALRVEPPTVEIHNHLPVQKDAPAPIIHNHYDVAAPVIHTHTDVHVPEAPAPVVNVEPAAVTVNVEQAKPRSVEFGRNGLGEIVSAKAA